ncbi:MAG: succinate--CoA ligase subunit alpha [Candidatus Aminicenantes bacterium]|nr:succinate--CoA ligase subunit alpha [Candidatus Aminicenantes bacterium]
MSILAGAGTLVLVQNMTGVQGTFHTRLMLEYGTRIVAGVTPGRGGQIHLGLPVFDSVGEAKAATGAEATVVFVPPLRAAEAVLEAAAAGLELIVCITEGIPILDMIRVKAALRDSRVRLIGPNTPGLISPGRSKLGIMPGSIHSRGPVGVISRSGTLTYEAVHQLGRFGLGQSTAVGMGGDPVSGLGFTELLTLFAEDGETEAVVLIGEIGGAAEEEAAAILSLGYPKPVVAYVAGETAPPERRMGHAGALVEGGQGTAAAKIAAFVEAGVRVVRNPALIGRAVKDVLG